MMVLPLQSLRDLKWDDKVKVGVVGTVQSLRSRIKYVVPMRFGDIPVLISNTMVKPKAADGTILETVWESRWVPHY